MSVQVNGVAEMLRSLGNVAVSTGEYQKARSNIQESLRLFQAQGDVRNVVYCLNSYASLAGITLSGGLAMKLLSVVDTQLKAMGMFMSPVDKAVFDQVFDEVRHAMSESEFEELWSEGERLALPDAVNLVLQEN